jgi:hypothetical protein
MSCNDACAVEKAEAKEFAYFSGLSAGAKAERKSLIYKLEHALIPSPIGRMGLREAMLNFIITKGDEITAGDVAEFAEYLISLLTEENK